MITGVAIRNDVITIQLPKPNRHCHCFAWLDKTFGFKVANEMALGMTGLNQGFITDKGVYLDRFQAMGHAKRFGQRFVLHDGLSHQWNRQLYSEYIW